MGPQGIEPFGEGDLFSYDNPSEYGPYLFDDPYKMLATQLIASQSLPSLHRIMVDNKYLLIMITRELQDADIASPFLDCVQDVMFRKNEKVKYKHALAKLASFVYSELDITRLRENISEFLLECGIDIMAE